MSMPDIWAYRASLVRVIDGDTLDVVIDQGLHTHRTERLRLLGVNAPEMKGPTRPAGLAAAGFVTDWLSRVPFDDEWPLIVQTHKGDAFGRWLARVWRRTDGACLNDTLLMVGHARPFMVVDRDYILDKPTTRRDNTSTTSVARGCGHAEVSAEGPEDHPRLHRSSLHGRG